MNIKIQYFTGLLFLLLALVLISIWSFSLFLQNDSLNIEKAELNRVNWQVQLDQLQAIQMLWLQQSAFEVNEWMENHQQVEQRLNYINQYYQKFPQIRLIQLGDSVTTEFQPNGFPADCKQLTRVKVTDFTNFNLPTVQACFFHQQPVLAISSLINHSISGQRLVILMDYFTFMDEFERLTGKNLYLQDKTTSYRHYVESGVEQQPMILQYEFVQGALSLGSLSISSPKVNYFEFWKQQQIWVIPALLLSTLIAFVIFYSAIIYPLLRITHRIKNVVVTRRPGSAYDFKRLTPGLRVLHKYFMHLTYITKHDPLTGLTNRVIFEERLKQAIAEGKRSGRKYALTLVDINHFYKVNKKYGNYIGDGLLKQLAKRLSNGLRESDNLARLEKDNFALLLEFTDIDQVTSLVEKLFQSLSKPYTVYGREISVGISIGVAIYPDHALDMEELEMKGNEALLQAHQGDWPVVFIQRSADQMDYSGLSLIQSLRQALANEDFKLVYQPVMDLKNHSTGYFEALLRWKQPQTHTQSIEQTIALAEKNQLIKPLSQWIIESACLQLKKLTDFPVKIAVNLSMIDFHDEDLPDCIGETLQRCGVAAEQLMVEITEGQIMQEPEQVIAILTRLSEMGISLSIDDFGTGQASLTYLKKLPVEKLKIDQSFVKNMDKDDEDSTIVEATIKLAHTLGIEVVAEGVESAAIHALLVNMGCDYVQGYYISKPVDEESILHWIVEKN